LLVCAYLYPSNYDAAEPKPNFPPLKKLTNTHTKHSHTHGGWDQVR